MYGGDTALVKAIENNKEAVVHALLRAGADVNAEGGAALREASREGNASIVNILLQAGADVNAQADEDSNFALYSAASSVKGYQVIPILVHAGADVNQTCTGGATALMIAAASGSLRAIRMLLKAGANINATDDVGKSPLMYAVSKKQWKVVKMLLNPGNGATELVRINDRNTNGFTALRLAVSNHGVGALRVVLELLKMPDLDVNSKYEKGNTALSIAVKSGNLTCFRALLADSRTDVNVSDDEGMTALGYAVLERHTMAAKRLLRRSDIEVNKNPLFALCLDGNCDLDMLNLLVGDDRVDPNVGIDVGRGKYDWISGDYSKGDTCLKMCLRSEYTSYPDSEVDYQRCLAKLRLLLSMPRINVNKLNDDGMSALQYMVFNNEGPAIFVAKKMWRDLFLDKLRMLLAVDTLDVNLKCKGDTALMMALQEEFDYSHYGRDDVLLSAAKEAEPGFRRAIVAMLLTARGMDVTIHNAVGESALELTTDLEIQHMLANHASAQGLRAGGEEQPSPKRRRMAGGAGPRSCHGHRCSKHSRAPKSDTVH